MYLGRGIDQIDNIATLDNLSFNGSDTVFNLTQNSVAFNIISVSALQIQIDGVIQVGNFTQTGGSQITFDFTPNANSVCNSVKHFGVGLLSQPSDGSVNMAQLGASGTKSSSTFLAGDNTFKTVSGTTINNNADNRVITGSGTANTLNGESTLTYDGTQLVLTDGTEGTDNLLVKTTADGSISMALEKSDLKYDLGLDHNNDGSQNFYIRERTKNGSTTNSKRMVIDNDGEITKPLQPTFMTNQVGALTVANGHTLFSTNTTERWDVGSNLSGPTFTAPVTGKYFLNFDVLWEGNTSDSSFEARITTSNRNYSFNRNSRQYANNSTYIANSGSAIADMDAGDTAIVVHVGPTTAVHADNNWSWFQGYLLG